MNKFLKIHCHSKYSLRDGIASIDAMVNKSIKDNENFTLTDHGSMGGVIEYYNTAKKNNIKPVFGNELYVNNNKKKLFEINKILADKSLSAMNKKYYTEIRDNIKKANHLVVLAKNEHGFYNLIELSNKAMIDGFYRKPMIDYNDLFSLPKDNGDRGLIITSACMASPIAVHILNEEYEQAYEWASMFKEEFGSDFYLEVQTNGLSLQKEINKHILQIANDLNIDVIVADDSHYLEKKHDVIQQDLLILQQDQTREDVDKIDYRIVYENKKREEKVKKVKNDQLWQNKSPSELFEGEQIGNYKIIKIEKVNRVFGVDNTQEDKDISFKSEKEIRASVKKYHQELENQLDNIIKNNYNVNTKIKEFELDESVKLPYIKDSEKKLKELIKQGLAELNLVKREYVNRIKYELDIIISNGFSTYFLILYDLIREIKKREIALGPGRGSSAGSLIAYCLGITRLDPIYWNLPFERFLDVSRNIKKVIIETEEGKEEYKENDELIIIREKKEKIIKAIDIKKNDIFKEVYQIK